ncbi:MAG: hypothetical protein HUU55_20375 [Myxococcales bacterium]|nr:hypothetical protein [Myxococcales bacterium]
MTTHESSTYNGLVPLEAVPQARRAMVGPDAPVPARMMAAKALLPMPPDELVPTLAYLGSVPEQEISTAARASAIELPENIMASILGRREMNPHVLDYYGRLFVGDSRYAEIILLNSSTPDETVRVMTTRTKRADLLDLVAQNQVRYLRYPSIIEALYYNSETRMGAVSRAIESAARNDVSLAHIPGFREIQASILGTGSFVASQVADEDETEDLPIDEDPDVEDAGIPEDDFQAMLRGAAQELESREKDDIDVAESHTSLWRQINEMSVPQKVRMALIGNATARRVLVRDAKKTVAMAVLRSPGLTDKEVQYFAQQKSLHEDVIAAIARNREWTRLPTTRMALVRNPKTPARYATSFLLALPERDQKLLSRDREIPGYLQRLARNMVAAKEAKKNG